MKLETLVAILSVVMTFLGIGLTIVTGYLAYLTFTLKKRVKESVLETIKTKNIELTNLIEARLALVDIAVESVCSFQDSSLEKRKEDEVYFLKHISRLTSEDASEINRALGALEAAGSDVSHLLPYVERVRCQSKWPKECQIKFDRMLRDSRKKALQEQNHS